MCAWSASAVLSIFIPTSPRALLVVREVWTSAHCTAVAPASRVIRAGHTGDHVDQALPMRSSS
ncbi:hypothetical protein CBOM_07688 [Ceraceosorus bombacis]|uniref:Secreted protein n=1 Tax=Ceraceosorus bombacis TaxID=401625 RepID=A0A0P1BNZ1_9BASI|nr:hypothetical protein CBOM_07688 [Ceraceosorus bombacis]